MVGKSLLINTSERLKRVSVTDPGVADIDVVTPTQVLVHGRSAGEVSLLIWDELERSRSFDLRVDVDVTAAAEEEKSVFPDEQIIVTPSRSAIVLSGHVSDESVAQRAGRIAEAYSKNVVNVLTYGPKGAQEVLLEVKFAEVDRSALTQLGFNVFSTGATNTIGRVTTGQFPAPSAPATVGGGGTAANQATSTFSISDALNIFAFRPDLNLAVLIKALQARNLLQILAEPNLVTTNGKEASFLVGGEFPIPILQGGANSGAVTIQFREFGIRLTFNPVVTENNTIRLYVKPEVSALDFAHAVSFNGFTIPALSTRRMETNIELGEGQSFVIGGLIDNRLTETISKIPGLSSLPILGNLFKTKEVDRNNTELVVMVTPEMTMPLQPGEAKPMPVMPRDFLTPLTPSNQSDPYATKPKTGGRSK